MAQRRVPAGPDLVAGLRTDVPLGLFPVRLATRFYRGEGRANPPTELWLRIYPDAIHADGHQPVLTDQEVRLGRSYWRRLWRTGTTNAPAREAVHLWLARQLGAPRAAWVAEQTTPVNLADAPAEPVPDGERPDPAPEFAPPQIREGSRPVRARLLPDRWRVVLRGQRGEARTAAWSSAVRLDLALAPRLTRDAALPPPGSVFSAEDLLRGQHLDWLIDVETAVKAGMALKVPLPPGLQTQIEDVLVFGVRGATQDATAPDADADELADLLEAHRRTFGLEVVAQGTPTNTVTDPVSGQTLTSGFAPMPDDLEAYFARQRETPQVSRPTLDRRYRLATAAAADALALAFGLDGVTAFDHAELATDQHGQRARAMNRVLWPTTLAILLTELLGVVKHGVMTGDDVDWLREWFRDWVRAGGLLPVVRVGEQPYGVLPVTRMPEWDDAVGNRRIDHLTEVLRDQDAWNVYGGFFAAFDGGFFQEPLTPEETALRTAEVLGAVPHPTAFRLRPANDRFASIDGTWRQYRDDLERLIARTTSNYIDYYEDPRYLSPTGPPAPPLKDLITTGTIDEQISAAWNLRHEAEDQLDTAVTSIRDSFETVIVHIDTYVLPTLEAHRVRAASRTMSAAFPGATLADPGDPSLWYTIFEQDNASTDSEDGSVPRLELVAKPDKTAADVAAFLRARAEDARAVVAGGPRPKVDVTEPRSLLIRLVWHAVTAVSEDRADEVASGLDRLADMLEAAKDEHVDDPLDMLGLLLRETLGLVTHRYDAWVSSLAGKRLADMRAATPTGLQLGGYAWLVNLAADDGDEGDDPAATTAGFVHAPSLDHAATAAVLRSSWLAHRESGGDVAFGVDLSSGRARRATWLLDGVRAGTPLGELVGARVERALQDAGMADRIDDLRSVVAGAGGDSTGGTGEATPGSGVVDGLAIGTVLRDPDAADPVLREAVDTFIAADDRSSDLRGVLGEAVADVDAVADALTAQSVHSLLTGRLAEAAAAMSAATEGGVAPNLSVLETTRRQALITHQVLAILGPDQRFTQPGGDSGGGPGTLLRLAEPGLARWLDGLLDVPQPWARLGLTAAEVVALADPSGELDASLLGRLLASVGTGAQPGDRRPDLTALTDASARDTAVVAGALRAAVGSARPLRGADLDPTGEMDWAADTADLQARAAGVVARLREIAAAQDDVLRRFLADLAVLAPAEVRSALRAATPEERVERRDALRDLASAVADRVEQVSSGSPQDLADDLRLVTGGLPVLPRSLPALDPADPAGAEGLTRLATSLRASDQRVPTPLAPMRWLLQVGKVHDGAGRIADALDLAEVLRPGGAMPMATAQVPDARGEPWVAIERPSDDRARRHLLCLSDAADVIDALASGQPQDSVSGLVFDTWTEPIPARSAATGVALHIDQPSVRAPQAVLLAMGPQEGPWTVEEIETILRQTMDAMRSRAVGPQTLGELGQELPAVFLPDGAQVALAEDLSADDPAVTS